MDIALERILQFPESGHQAAMHTGGSKLAKNTALHSDSPRLATLTVAREAPSRMESQRRLAPSQGVSSKTTL